jgi:hypothetical protein
VADRSGVTAYHDGDAFEWRIRITHEDARRLDPVDLALVETGLAQVAAALRLPPPAPIEGTAREHATTAPALPPAGAAA